ncbi:hypothetical protein HG530_011027 [Fusarium avenaceum]|nr:hypothetical protein HG530_011027 [Fusarium avenaceum]
MEVTTANSDNSAGSSDNLKLEGVIRAETEAGAERRVATTKSETSKTNGRALARDTGEALGSGELNRVGTLNTSAKLKRRTSVELLRPLDNLRALHVMGPDSEGASASRATKVARLEG